MLRRVGERLRNHEVSPVRGKDLRTALIILRFKAQNTITV